MSEDAPSEGTSGPDDGDHANRASEATAAATEINIPSDELKQLIQYLANELGEEWLEAQAEGLGGVHTSFGRSAPIIEWFAMARRIAAEGRPVDEATLNIARISRSLKLLREAEAVGVDSRVEGLRSADTDKLMSTIQELVAACGYAEAGRQVEFIEEADEKRPDLLVDGTTEVECKFKVRESAADGRRYDLYSLLLRRVRSAIEAAEGVTGVRVEITFSKEPTREDIDDIVSLVRSVVKPEGPFAYVKTHGPVTYRVVAMTSNPFSGNILAAIPQEYVDEYDVIDMVGTSRVDHDGRLRTRAFSSLAIKCEVVQDRIKSLEASLKSGKRQFSGRGPAVIHVEVSQTLKGLIGEHLPRSRQVIERFLRSNPSVSALVIEYGGSRLNEDGSAVLSRTTEAIWNEGARFPLSQALREYLDVTRRHIGSGG